MSANDVLEISRAFKSHPVRLVEPDGTPRNLTLREMPGLERDKWMTEMKGRASGADETIKRYENLQASLISRCLWDESNTLVPQQEISTWPATAQAALFRKCQELNGLTDASLEQEKNS